MPETVLRRARRVVAGGGLLLFFTAIAYLPVFQAGFVFDDYKYVLQNPHVTSGLNTENLRWALATFYGGTWHPLTWASHMLDVQLFGLSPAGHHLVGLALHLANTALLILVLLSLTGSRSRSLLAACLFALHPLRVESVAWVAERKDVLSAFFFLLSLAAYRRYLRRRSAPDYCLVLVCLSLGLMSKSMLVTFPFVLLLLDWWPLGRFRRSERIRPGWDRWSPWVDKLPMIALAAFAALISTLSQRSYNATEIEVVSLGARAVNALVSIARYLLKTLVPVKLAVFYPFPAKGWPLSGAAAALALLAGVTILALKLRDRRPAIAVGWFWFIGMLMPVSGLVQVGMHAMADRFTYLPSLGLSIALCWGLGGLIPMRSWRTPFLPFVLSAGFAGMAVLTWNQVRYWGDNRTLFAHAIAVTRDNWLAHNMYGLELLQEGRLAEAEREFERFVELRPNNLYAHFGLALVLERSGRIEDAIDQLRRVLLLAPERVEAYFELGSLLARQGKHLEAIAHYREALRLRPNLPDAYLNIGNSYSDIGREEEAISSYQAVLRLDPRHEMAYFNIGLSLEHLGRLAEAASNYRQALTLNPRSPQATRALARLAR